MKQVYLGGGMLDIGDQMRREYEKSELTKLGYKVYAPQDDKDINDKHNAHQDDLAERIVLNDTLGMQSSQILIFDYLPHNQGTICEMGFVQYMLKDLSRLSMPIYAMPKVYVQCTDIRQGTGHISKEQDRQEFSINQYVYGVILEITEGRGIQTFDEILEDLK
ncbi:nucleoside 2-deoxyribosyltransferase [Staphylococcus chromogenes]|uniref:nucleoside 2-deoxyribosyltransferase n=1 Tax=Staphylococcus chromogenes TaxID=46126 RepID=UPI001F38302C|nr:nucleoside 2-deoxyribosyltransferase [Staphylococcus chromogenes]MCE5093411.1 nucleoside 2-deoxyribosyltransferase [Staphylococcus chromogenes]